MDTNGRKHGMHRVGLVTACAWDSNGEASKLCLSCAGEQDYLLRDNDIFEELLYLIGECVEVFGEVVSDPDGTMTIVPTKYRIVPMDEDLSDLRIRHIKDVEKKKKKKSEWDE